ncbi:uncharacterized protein LOC122257161 isoform X1 [Penaeus japonicus]|uniref:uncharacterized protein LOC122257161 isoform X1 n=1 Tax=Penaeus japonicus TaxID=27405 RepID=UPI001C70E1C8|nr:uncharacterized protein LOC122257161 isoform X1 [Penaeus japonicus]
MFGIFPVAPRQRNTMAIHPLWAGDTWDMMESMMDEWNDAGPIMTRRPCPTCLATRYAHDTSPRWTSLLNRRPLLLRDVSSLLVPFSDISLHDNEQGQKNKEEQGSKQQRKTQGAQGNGQEAGPSTKESKKDEDADKPWQYSVDVGGCDEVRAFVEDGMLMVEGRGQDGDASVMVRHVTSVPSHVKPDALKATLKEDGRLLLSSKSDSEASAVTNISIYKLDQQDANQGEKKQVQDSA